MKTRLNWIIITTLVLCLFGQALSPSVLAVTPAISLTPASGSPGKTVTVTGTDFSVNETEIVVTFDDAVVSPPVIANTLGGWTTTFVVPQSPSGPHRIYARGAITTNATVVFFTVTPGISISRTSGGTGVSVSVNGSGFAISETGISVTYDGTSVATATANSQGSWTASFIVPVSASGQHTIDAGGVSTSVAAVPDIAYSVTPTLSVNKPNGAVGSAVIVSGSGFAAGETGISVTYDGASVASAITANAQGSWTASFEVPASASGGHIIDAGSVSTPATSTADAAFAVTPTILANRGAGTVGSPVTVTGFGFGANERAIMVTFEGNPVVQGTTANAQGSWSATFAVPASASGAHPIDASGPSSSAISVPDVLFATSPGISANRAGGATGSSITVTGSGFGAGETGIIVTYDGEPVARGITANAQGGWTANFIVPSSTSGSHTISASGSFTRTTSATETGFSIGAAILAEPAFGHIGETVTVSGSGFAANSPLRFIYDGKEVLTEQASTDTSGSFNRSVTIPKSRAGAHAIEVTDGQRNTSKVAFSVENTPPPAPTPLSPQDGSKTGLLGNAKPTLKWSGVSDPSGITYVLQIDTDPDFSQPLLEKSDIQGSRYVLTAAEALPRGEYYWRVRAVDGASNQGNWSRPWQVRSGIIEGWAIAVILIVLAVSAAATYFLILPRLRRRAAEQPIPVQEVPVPQVFPRRWQISAPGSLTPESAAPARLALPQPKKGKAFSTEEMARLKVLMDFAQSMPLLQPDFSASWVVDLLEATMGIEVSTPVLGQVLKGELQVQYEPAWMRHPTYQDLVSLLQGQPILQELDTFVSGVNQCASEASTLLQHIYRDAAAEIPPDFLERGGWNFIGGVYSDALSWFLGKSLRDPSERDYSVRPAPDETGENAVCLWGEDSTAFSGSLIQAPEQKEITDFRALHLRLRRAHRSDDRARRLVAIMTQMDVQRTRLINAFSQFGRYGQ